MSNYFDTNIRASLTHVPNNIIYRVHYNAETQICTHKTILESDTSDNYIVVNKEFYNSIDFCGNYQIIDKKLEKCLIKFQANNKKLIQTEGGAFKTTKNNMIFIIDNYLYLNESDSWGYE